LESAPLSVVKMKQSLSIQYRSVKESKSSPLLVQYVKLGRIIAISRPISAPCPKSINIGGIVVIDINDNDVIQNIDIVLEDGRNLKSIDLIYDRSDLYQDINIYSDVEYIDEDDANLSISRIGSALVVEFGERGTDREVRLGPSVWLLLGGEELRGVRADLSDLAQS